MSQTQYLDAELGLISLRDGYEVRIALQTSHVSISALGFIDCEVPMPTSCDVRCHLALQCPTLALRRVERCVGIKEGRSYQGARLNEV